MSRLQVIAYAGSCTALVQAHDCDTLQTSNGCDTPFTVIGSSTDSSNSLTAILKKYGTHLGILFSNDCTTITLPDISVPDTEEYEPSIPDTDELESSVPETQVPETSEPEMQEPTTSPESDVHPYIRTKIPSPSVMGFLPAKLVILFHKTLTE